MPLPKPWLERTGKISALRSIVFAALFMPLVFAIFGWFTGAGAARPFIEFNHKVGLWGYYLLIAALAISPLRHILHWPKLIVVRRMVGVAACLYIVLHVIAYAADKGFDIPLVASELVTRIYLTIGLAAFILLIALAATSTDAMVRRLGIRKWQGLHRGAYIAALLASIHFFLQMKLNVTAPTEFLGILLWLMAYRLIYWKYGVATAIHPATLAGLTIAAGLATALGEATYFHLQYHADPVRILRADLDFRRGPRPGWVVFFTGAAVTIAGVARRLTATAPKSGRI